MTEDLVVKELLRIDKTLEATYWCYQSLHCCFKNRNASSFIQFLHKDYSDVSTHMSKAIATLIKYQTYINNSFQYPYSDGVLGY